MYESEGDSIPVSWFRRLTPSLRLSLEERLVWSRPWCWLRATTWSSKHTSVVDIARWFSFFVFDYAIVCTLLVTCAEVCAFGIQSFSMLISQPLVSQCDISVYWIRSVCRINNVVSFRIPCRMQSTRHFIQMSSVWGVDWCCSRRSAIQGGGYLECGSCSGSGQLIDINSPTRSFCRCPPCSSTGKVWILFALHVQIDFDQPTMQYSCWSRFCVIMSIQQPQFRVRDPFHSPFRFTFWSPAECKKKNAVVFYKTTVCLNVEIDLLWKFPGLACYQCVWSCVYAHLGI